MGRHAVLSASSLLVFVWPLTVDTAVPQQPIVPTCETPTFPADHSARLGEGTVRVLEGFILITRQEGMERVNWASVPNQALLHTHISIVAMRDDLR